MDPREICLQMIDNYLFIVAHRKARPVGKY